MESNKKEEEVKYHNIHLNYAISNDTINLNFIIPKKKNGLEPTN